MLGFCDKYAGIFAIIGILLGGFWHMDGKFDKVNDRLTALDNRINIIENRITSMETVMIIEGKLPQRIAKNECEHK